MFGRGVRRILLGVMLFASSRALAMTAEVQQAAPVQHDKVKLDVKLDNPRVEQLTVKSHQSGTLPAESRVKTADGRTQIVVSADEPTVVLPSGTTPKRVSPRPLPKTAQSFDSLLIEPVREAGSSTLERINQWVLVVRAQQTPLRWNEEQRAYTTELIVGLQGSGASQGLSSSLSKPVLVQLTTRDAKVVPERLMLREGGVAGFRTALISLLDHSAKATVTALTDMGEQVYEVVAEPRLAGLKLELGDDSIAGFGFGTTRVTALRMAEDGREWFAPKPLEVPLAALGNGILDAEWLRFDKGRARSHPVEVRSSFLGESTLVATPTGIVAPSVVVRFTMPWTLLIAIALGSALGAGTRLLKRAKGSKKEFAVNFLSGLLVAFASLLGVASVIHLPKTALFTEAGCLVVAAIAAYLGSEVLQKLGDRFRSTPEGQPS